MFDKRTNLSRQVADEVRTHFPRQTLDTWIPRSVRISEAPSYGQTVLTYDPGSTGALAYRAAAQEVAERGRLTEQAATHEDHAEPDDAADQPHDTPVDGHEDSEDETHD